MVEKGTCKHGEFVLADGCPQCLEEQRQKIKDKISGGMEGVEDVAPKAEEVEKFTSSNDNEPYLPELNAGETALELRPGEDIEARGYFNEALGLLKYASARVIATVEDSKGATDDLSIISKLKRAMGEKRKSLLDPLMMEAEAIRVTYAYLMTPVLEADKITRDKLLAYSAEQDRIRREQEEINRKRTEAAEAEMKLTGELSESVNLVEVVPEPPKTVETDMGSAGRTDHWKYEVTDFALLPNEYKLPDTAMLNAIAKKHHDQKQIAGVRFYNEPIIAVRAR